MVLPESYFERNEAYFERSREARERRTELRACASRYFDSAQHIAALEVQIGDGLLTNSLLLRKLLISNNFHQFQSV